MFDGSFAHRSLKTRGATLRFAPYLLLAALPWLLLATTLRLYMKAAPDTVVLPVFVLVQFSVFMAFLVASEKMITLSGGWTCLAELTMGRRLAFAWQAIWRLLVVFLVAVVLALAAGTDKYLAATLWVGFDGLAFPWHQGPLQVWVAFISIVAFLFMIEKGAGNAPRFVGMLKLLITHRRILFFAWLYLGIILLALTYIQSRLAFVLGLFLDNSKAETLRTCLFIGFIVLFSHLRIWVIVALLTYAMKASYRRLGASKVEA